MINPQFYWKAVMERQAELEREFARDGIVWITSLEDPMRGLVGGRVCETSLRLGDNRHGIAAKNLVDGTHRIATQQEIDCEIEERARRCAASAVAQSRIDRQNKFLFVDQTKQLQALGDA